MNAEFKRMMQLAGLTEIKINKPDNPSISLTPGEKYWVYFFQKWWDFEFKGKSDDALIFKTGTGTEFDLIKKSALKSNEIKPYLGPESKPTNNPKLTEITVNAPTQYYAIFNFTYGENFYYLVTLSKGKMIEKLNKAYKELTGKDRAPYTLQDMEEYSRHDGTPSDVYVSDDWATVTKNASIFKEESDTLSQYGTLKPYKD